MLQKEGGDDGNDINGVNNNSKSDDKHFSCDNGNDTDGDGNNGSDSEGSGADEACEGVVDKESDVHSESHHKIIDKSENWAPNSDTKKIHSHRSSETITQRTNAAPSGNVDKDVLQSAVAIAASLAPWASKAVTRALGKANVSQSPSSSPVPAPSHSTTATTQDPKPTFGDCGYL